MIVNLIKNKEMFTLTLPNKVSGKHWISDYDDEMQMRQLIGIEAHHGEWILKSNKNISILDSSNQVVKSIRLFENSFINLKIANDNSRTILFSEPINESRYTFKKLVVKNQCSLTVGRTNNNNIVFDNKYVSSNHCTLSYDGSNWNVFDRNSTNGTYVNGYKVDSQKLESGDIIYIMGLKIIVGSNYLAINNPENKVSLNTSDFANFRNQNFEIRDNVKEAQREMFFRSPRLMRKIEPAKIKIDPPPAYQKPDDMPLALTLGPSMTMGIASLSTGVMAIINFASGESKNIASVIPTLCMSFSMLLGTILWPILTKKHDKKKKIENEKNRQEKYLQYLDSIRDKIKKECKAQSEILCENILSTNECIERINVINRTLWERTIEHDDFLTLRMGNGSIPLDISITYPEEKFSLDNDNLHDAMMSLGSEDKELHQVPISVSLIENYFCGIIGNSNDVMALAKSLIIQMIALHSYDELKIMLITNSDNIESWNFVRNIPHFWNEEKTQRYIAANYEEAKELSLIIDKEIIKRITSNKELSEYSPYYVIISDDKELSDRCDNLSELMKYGENAGFSVISLRNQLKDLPKEVATIISLNGNNSNIFNKNDLTGKTLRFLPEYVSDKAANNAAYVISNLYLDVTNKMYSLPDMITFLEMYKVSKIEHLNPLSRWEKNNPVKSLQAAVGVDTQGELFYLDLHEKYHGPHGLVAGTTGSGKSEFIITYILSLAVNYHPDEVAFILIDYKGGGLTGAFEDEERGIKLPHLAGTITNLDGASIKRSLISIQSELRRRQAIFNKARKISNEGTMDIYKYQQLYRDKVVDEPVPHLFIISDEFAELKTQQPEFMEQLISAARIGRSLGVHLILATQKPSGVVDDQIWSNSKFRVCLKVQDKADSQDMIKCSDAAEISQTGRFYLQVGFNEFFALGQSAWCGADYVPTETVEKAVDDSVEIIDNMGHVIKSVKPEKKESNGSPKIKQIVGIVKLLSDLAREENIVERPLWLEPISDRIFVKQVEEKYGFKSDDFVLNPVIGEYDDPFNQKQDVVTIPLSKEGNCLVYGAAGNGKTTFLATLLYSLISSHSVDALNAYVLDFGSETLKAFEKAPHVGSVAVSSDEEKVTNLFKMLIAELNYRKQLFSDYGGDYDSYCRLSNNTVPNILVAINNYAGFAEQFEQLDESFGLLLRDGVKYGIIFVVTVSTTNAMRYRYLQNFKQVLTMQLNDPTDYRIVLGQTDGQIPAKFKGRGLINIIEADKVFEFQTAYCSDCDDQYEFIRDYCQRLCETADKYAKPIPVLPDFVKAKDVSGSVGDFTLPIGIEKKTMKSICIDYRNTFIYPVVAADTYILESFAVEFAVAADKISSSKVQVLNAENWQLTLMSRAQIVSGDFNDCLHEIFEDVLARNNGYKAAGMSESFFNDFEDRLIIIYGFEKLLNKISGEIKEELLAMLFKGQALYKIHFIILDSAVYLNSQSYENWYKAHIKANNGLYVGDGFADQYVLKANRHSNSFYDEIGNQFGYALVKGKEKLVKLLTSEVEE